jgi:CheY-like chemotaxis protein
MPTTDLPIHVLLVEDELADVCLTRLALEEGQVPAVLHRVCDGVEALAFLCRETPYRDAPRPDLILLDLNLPRMDGRTLLAKLKGMDSMRRIPVVVLTTSDAERDVAMAYDLGAAGFIVKPLDMKLFVAKLKGLENYWTHVVRRPPL